MKTIILLGKPKAGNPRVRFDEGKSASARPRWTSLFRGREKAVVCFFTCVSALVCMAETCIVSGSTVRTVTANKLSETAATVTALAPADTAANETGAFDSRTATEDASEWIPIDTRAPKGTMLIVF